MPRTPVITKLVAHLPDGTRRFLEGEKLAAFLSTVRGAIEFAQKAGHKTEPWKIGDWVEDTLPSRTLGLVARELDEHIALLRRTTPIRANFAGRIILLKGAATLVRSVNDGMSNTDRVAAVEEALRVLRGEGD